LRKVAEQIIAETRCLQPERSVAYRNRHRWTPTLSIARRDRQVPPLRDGGVYLLVNALNGLGQQFALYLARNTRAALVIAESQGVPDRELWNQYNSSSPGTDSMEFKISRVRELEKAAQLLCASTPFCEPAAPESIVNQALQEFGRLDGVLYFFDCGQSAGQSTHSTLRELDALSSAVAERDLDFRLLISSITSTDPLREEFGVPFLFDAFAARSARQERAWTSITWLPETCGSAHNDAIAAAFNQTAVPNLVVSPEPLSEGWNKLAAMLGSLQQPEAPAQVSNYPRPNLRVAYAPPATETEQRIAQIWRDLLGLKEIGIHDNFLDLGGDSLMATRLVSRMKDVFQQDVPVRVVFESSTIAELARAVDEVAEKAADSDDVDELMEMLDQLSEEEVEQELLRRKQSLAQGA
jgi:acyl carrier protein